MPRTPLSNAAKERGRALKARLKAARDQRSQEDVAAAAGMRLATLKAIEDPRRSFHPGFFAVADIARVLGIRLQELDETTQRPATSEPLQ